jgi:RimJ/RimL family protein N-acetyltransferase
MKVAHPVASLTDGSIELREWAYDDVGCVEAAGADPRIPAGTTVPAHFTPQAGRAFIERQWSRADAGEGISLAIHAVGLGKAVGLVSMMLRPQPGVIGLGYWIVPVARGQGYATRAALLASDWALGDGGFARIEAWVEPNNVASQAVLAAAGFEREGLLRSFLVVDGERSDAFVYARVVA